jgi:DNA-directed RNA polymerase subunit RPC12/RpoP
MTIKETDFMNEGWKKPAKILILSLILSFFFFFLFWTLISPILWVSKIHQDIVRFSFALFFSLSLIFVSLIYMKYAMGACPSCGKKLSFTKDKEGIRCFGCGRFLKIDSQRKKLVL